MILALAAPCADVVWPFFNGLILGGLTGFSVGLWLVGRRIWPSEAISLDERLKEIIRTDNFAGAKAMIRELQQCRPLMAAAATELLWQHFSKRSDCREQKVVA